MPKAIRTRNVTPPQARAYVGKAEEFLAAAESELRAGRSISATSLAIHAGINSSDAVTGLRTGQRAAGQDHEGVRALLRDAGQDGAELERSLARLLPLKTKAEYEPDEVSLSEATRAVDRATRCVAIAKRLAAAAPS